jgi:hypothetical protein
VGVGEAVVPTSYLLLRGWTCRPSAVEEESRNPLIAGSKRIDASEVLQEIRGVPTSAVNVEQGLAPINRGWTF